MLNLILFGGPGCGKGTQAALLQKRYGLEHVSTGEVIRAEIAAHTPLGRQMEACIAEGRLAPDQVVIDMMDDYVASHLDSKGCIFDGFPRTTIQAEALDRILAKYNLDVDLTISLAVPEELLVERMLERGKISGRADDASEEIIRNRIEVYHRQTAIVAEHYAAQGKYVVVDGYGTIDEVFQRICDVIDGRRGETAHSLRRLEFKLF